MAKAIAAVVVLVFVLGLPGASTHAQTIEAEPQFVVEAVYDAVESGDIDAALELLADDAVLTVLPAPRGSKLV